MVKSKRYIITTKEGWFMKSNTLMKNKYFLYATEFFAGMSVMGIELGASRLLAPYFSSSQIVWTIIIGAIMIAMALGNIWGGRMADKNPDPGKLYHRLLIAAIWTAAIPFVGKHIIAWISFGVAAVITNNFLIWASLLSCLILFVFPLMLLGTVTPSLVKYTVQDLESNGATVGRLGALNTIGSIIGTFLPTFVTIPAVGTAATFLIFAGILALLSILYFISIKKMVIKGAACVVLIIGLLFACPDYSFAFGDPELVYEGESIYNYLQVKEDDTSIKFATSVMYSLESVKMKDRTMTGMYYDVAMAAPFMANMTEKPGEVLILGLGTGTYASLCNEYFPQSHVDGVEIDEKITQLATEYFDLPPNLDMMVNDGRAYLQTDKKYDVIMVDAYKDITIPYQMSTVEFFQQVREHLNEGGVMVVNLSTASEGEGTINEYLCDTIASVFPQVYSAQLGEKSNVIVYAFEEEKTLDTFYNTYPDYESDVDNEQLKLTMEAVEFYLEKVEKGLRIFTDDKAPVELLGMKALDDLIQDDLVGFKDAIKDGTWRELLEQY
jgi:spermidine synthase